MIVGPWLLRRMFDRLNYLENIAEEAAWGTNDYSDLVEQELEKYKDLVTEVLQHVPFFEIDEDLAQRLSEELSDV